MTDKYFNDVAKKFSDFNRFQKWDGSSVEVLSFDLGTKTGLASRLLSRFECGRLEWSHMTTYEADYAANAKMQECDIFSAALENMANLISPRTKTFVVYEDVMRWSGGAAAKRYGGLLACLRLACAKNDNIIGLMPCPIRSAKMALTGLGNATKQQMIDFAASRYGLPDTITDNEADAVAINHWMQSAIEKGLSNGKTIRRVYSNQVGE